MSGLDPLSRASIGATFDPGVAELSAHSADTAALRAVLKDGDVVSARVLPPENGSDYIEIAGRRVAAALPPTVRPGDVLILEVVGFEADRISVRNLGVDVSAGSGARSSPPVPPTLGGLGLLGELAATSPQELPAAVGHAAPASTAGAQAPANPASSATQAQSTTPSAPQPAVETTVAANGPAGSQPPVSAAPPGPEPAVPPPASAEAAPASAARTAISTPSHSLDEDLPPTLSRTLTYGPAPAAASGPRPASTPVYFIPKGSSAPPAPAAPRAPAPNGSVPIAPRVSPGGLPPAGVFVAATLKPTAQGRAQPPATEPAAPENAPAREPAAAPKAGVRENVEARIAIARTARFADLDAGAGVPRPGVPSAAARPGSGELAAHLAQRAAILPSRFSATTSSLAGSAPAGGAEATPPESTSADTLAPERSTQTVGVRAEPRAAAAQAVSAPAAGGAASPASLAADVSGSVEAARSDLESGAAPLPQAERAAHSPAAVKTQVLSTAVASASGAGIRAAAAGPPPEAPVRAADFREPVALLRSLHLPVTPASLSAATLALERPERLPAALEALEKALPDGARDPRVATLKTLAAFVTRLDPRSPAFAEQLSAYVQHVVEGPESRLSTLLQTLARAQAQNPAQPQTPSSAQNAPGTNSAALPNPAAAALDAAVARAFAQPAPAGQSPAAPAAGATVAQPGPEQAAGQPPQASAPAAPPPSIFATPSLPPGVAAATAASVVEHANALGHDLKTQLQSILAAPPGGATEATSAAAQSALTALTASQLSSVIAAQQDPSAIAFAIPLPFPSGHAARITIKREAPQRGERLDADNFHIGFVLDTHNLGTIALDLKTVGRAVSVSVHTENSDTAKTFDASLGDLATRLESLRYRVASMQAAVAPRGIAPSAPEGGASDTPGDTDPNAAVDKRA